MDNNAQWLLTALKTVVLDLEAETQRCQQDRSWFCFPPRSTVADDRAEASASRAATLSARTGAHGMAASLHFRAMNMCLERAGPSRSVARSAAAVLDSIANSLSMVPSATARMLTDGGREMEDNLVHLCTHHAGMSDAVMRAVMEHHASSPRLLVAFSGLAFDQGRTSLAGELLLAAEAKCASSKGLPVQESRPGPGVPSRSATAPRFTSTHLQAAVKVVDENDKARLLRYIVSVVKLDALRWARKSTSSRAAVAEVASAMLELDTELDDVDLEQLWDAALEVEDVAVACRIAKARAHRVEFDEGAIDAADAIGVAALALAAAASGATQDLLWLREIDIFNDASKQSALTMIDAVERADRALALTVLVTSQADARVKSLVIKQLVK